MKRICYFGIYDPGYSRNAILVRGLRECGHEITECRVDPKEINGFRKYWHLWKKGRALRYDAFDYVIVGFPGHSVVWLARLLFGPQIIFDAFLSLYDSNVFDRKLYSPKSFRGFKDWLLDWCSCYFAQTVLVDTDCHRDYFASTFKLPKSKFIRVFVGANETVFKGSGDVSRKDLLVHFHGNYIPLQGIEYIIEAIHLLKDTKIQFRLVGAGQESKKIESQLQRYNLTNVTVIGKVALSEIARYINDADICLGIFGNTEKAQRVIPNKVYECVAMGKPVITADTPAIRELFTDRENIYLCEAANSEALARAITALVNDVELRERLGSSGYNLFTECLTAKKIAKDLLVVLEAVR